VDLTGAIRGTSLRLAHLVVVPAVTDLDTETLDAKSLIVWLFVIANGKSLLARSAVTRDSVADEATWLQHEAAMRYKQTVGLCAEFARVEARLASALQQMAATIGSKWQVQVGAKWQSERKGGLLVINSLLTFQFFYVARGVFLVPARIMGRIVSAHVSDER